MSDYYDRAGTEELRLFREHLQLMTKSPQIIWRSSLNHTEFYAIMYTGHSLQQPLKHILLISQDAMQLLPSPGHSSNLPQTNGPTP
jgi:hypothetical protein